MKSLSTYALMLCFVLMSAVAHANNETSAIASPKCDMAKIKKIAGNGVVKIEKGAWEGGFNITLDTSKTSFQDLTTKMVEAGCF